MKQKGFTWTSKLAYAVGLLTTDGNLSPDGRHLELTSIDAELIDTFKECLGLKNKTGRKKSSFSGKLAYRVQFGSVLFYKKLLEIGLMPRKSKILGKLQIPDKFFFDFLRGVLDGDGSIMRRRDSVYDNSIRLYTRFTSGSRPHLEWLQGLILKQIGVKGYIQNKPRSFDLTFAKKDSVKLLKRIYYQEGLPCLKRKLEIAQEFLQ